jgi:hypothetical protein
MDSFFPGDFFRAIVSRSLLQHASFALQQNQFSLIGFT